MRLMVVLAFAIVAAPLRAQTDPCRQRSVAVNVFNDQNKIIPGLAAANFQASFRNQPVKILSVTQSEAPRVVIILDASGSMVSRKEVWDFSIDAAKQLTNSLPPSALLGLVAFSTQVEKSVSLTADRQTILRELEALSARRRAMMNGVRKTALWDSMGHALSLFGQLTPGDTLYVISDGHDTASRLQSKDLEQYTSTLRVFALIPDSLSPEDLPAQEILRYVTHSGGFAIVVSRERQLDETSNEHFILGTLGLGDPPTVLRITEQETRQFQRIGSFYVVSLELPGPTEKPNDWRLKVAVGKESGNHRLNVTYPTRLGPCGIANPL
jgi:hypothetical protein